jgi:hypothetical protein
MNDIGHLEFGELHRPIRFDGTNVLLRRYPPDSPDYWLAYWVTAFEHIIRHQDKVLLMSYERLCEQGMTAFSALQAYLQIEQAEVLDEIGTVFKAPTRYNVEDEMRDTDLLDRALALHRDLLEISVV